MCGDYLGNADAYQLRIPNLRRLMHEGSYSPRTLSVFPTLTGTAHTALVTGTGAMKHGILCWDCSCPTPTASQSSECSSGRGARSPNRTTDGAAERPADRAGDGPDGEHHRRYADVLVVGVRAQ